MGRSTFLKISCFAAALLFPGCFLFVGFCFFVFFSVGIGDSGLDVLLLAIWRQVVFRFGYSTLGPGREALEFRMILAKRQASSSKGKANSYVKTFEVTQKYQDYLWQGFLQAVWLD